MTQGKIIGAIAIAAALIIAASVGIWVMFLHNSAPAPVSLAEAVASLSTLPADTATGEQATPTSPETKDAVDVVSVTPTNPDNALEKDGDPTRTMWTIAESGDTFVGYRIGEELATIGKTEAVGRTSSVTGTVVISGSVVETVTVEANLQALASDDHRRDQTLRDRGLETGSCPTATFVLTNPIDLGGEPAEGAIYSMVVTGELTLHGITQPIQLPLEAQLVGGSFVVVGSLEIELSDYNITPPTTRIALAVDDHGTMEMQLILVPVVQ